MTAWLDIEQLIIGSLGSVAKPFLSGTLNFEGFCTSSTTSSALLYSVISRSLIITSISLEPVTSTSSALLDHVTSIKL